MTDSASLHLLGSWLLEARNADEPESRIVRFKSGGAMVYTIVVDEREIVMQLTCGSTAATSSRATSTPAAKCARTSSSSATRNW